VEAVFGFIENNRLRPVYDLVGDFIAAVSWQTVHEQRIFIGQAEQIGVDTVGFQDLAAVRDVGVAHRHPGVGDDEVGVLYSRQRILAERA